MKTMRFYWCSENKAVLLDMGESSSQCRNQGIELLEANTQDAATEKHVPIFNLHRGHVAVKVGEQPHPMLPEHYIEWIMVQTSAGGVFRKLFPGDLPRADFQVDNQEIMGIYAYCNLHGLWKASTHDTAGFHETVCAAEFKECIDS